jgi:hypothetical protein
MTRHAHHYGEHVTGDLPVDDRLVHQVREAIDTSYLRRWSGRLQVTCDQGVIIIGGRLPSYYLKQVLQTIVRPLPGVQGIQNRVVVEPASATREERSTK